MVLLRNILINNKKKGFLMTGLFLDALSLRFEIPQTPTDELSMIGYLADFFDSSVDLIPKGMTGYPLHARINLPVGSAIVRYGSTEYNMTLHVEAKGAGAELLRSFVLFHPALVWVCTRVDVACDFVYPTAPTIDMRKYRNSEHKPRSKDDAYWSLFTSLNRMAKQKNIVTSTAGNGWLGYDGGRTLYIGAPSSLSMFRFYEKSQERWQAGDKDYPDGVIRFEWQYQPKGKQRQALTSLDPEDIIGLNRTAVHFFEFFGCTGVEFRRIKSEPKNSDLAALTHGLKQYGNCFDRLANEKGLRWVLRYCLDVLGVNDRET